MMRLASRATCFLLVAAAVAAACGGPPPPASQPLPRDAALWQRIEARHRSLVPGNDGPPPADEAIRRRTQLLDLVRTYLSSYPGGAQRDRAVRLELEMLFEIGVLRGGDFKPLRQRIAHYLRHSPCAAAADEAAWWAIVTRRIEGRSGGPPVASGPMRVCDAPLLEALRAYVKRCPGGRHLPAAMRQIFADAARRDDLKQMSACVERLRKGFPNHIVTRELAATLKRCQAVGKPLTGTLTDAAGKSVPVSTWRGRPLLIVFWAGCNAPARACVRAVEAFRLDHPELRVIGVNLDASAEIGRAAAGELGLPWPQFNDGLGFANAFARAWGVRHVPLVFAVDRDGTLVGTAGAADWRPLAERITRPRRSP